MCLVLNSRHLLLLSVPPDCIQVLQQLVHESLRDTRGAPVSKVMRHLEGLLWDPVVTLPLEVLKSECALWGSSVALAQLLCIIDVGAWVHVSDVVLLGVQS